MHDCQVHRPFLQSSLLLPAEIHEHSWRLDAALIVASAIDFCLCSILGSSQSRMQKKGVGEQVVSTSSQSRCDFSIRPETPKKGSYSRSRTVHGPFEKAGALLL